jgi:hypothetical protein
MEFKDEPMEDLTALAVRLSQSVGDARGVLILSRDGLVLGACPADAEERLKVPWLRFASLGEPERGFLQFGGEIWSYVRRGAYAGFVVTGFGVRPGFVLDQIEIALLHAEEARARREGLRAEAAPQPAAPSGKPRTPLHPEPRPEPPVVIRAEAPSAPAQPAASSSSAPAAPSAPSAPSPPASPAPPIPSPLSAPPTTAPSPEPGRAAPPEAAPEPVPGRASADGPQPIGAPQPGPWGGVAGGSEERVSEGPGEEDPEEAAGEEIDRFSLAREFSKLLQERDEGADG